MKARLALVGSVTALLLVPAAPAEAHVVTCAKTRAYAAERVVILKNNVQATSGGARATARLGICLPGSPDHTVTWTWTLTLTLPTRTIECFASFDVYAAASGMPGNPLTDHPTVLGYRPKTRNCS
jgi:hypothetical protein